MAQPLDFKHPIPNQPLRGHIEGLDLWVYDASAASNKGQGFWLYGRNDLIGFVSGSEVDKLRLLLSDEEIKMVTYKTPTPGKGWVDDLRYNAVHKLSEIGQAGDSWLPACWIRDLRTNDKGSRAYIEVARELAGKLADGLRDLGYTVSANDGETLVVWRP